jgi:hypothetical protein
LLYAKPWSQSQHLQGEYLGQKALYYAGETSFHIVPLIFVVLPLGAFFLRLWRTAEANRAPAPVTRGRSKRLSGSKAMSNSGAVGIWRRFLERSRRRAPATPVNTRCAPASSDEITTHWERVLLLCLPSFVLVMVFAPVAFVRYLLPVAPLLTIMLAVWLFRHIRNLAVITVLVLILSMHNGFALLSGVVFPNGLPFLFVGHVARWPLINYIQCITTPYHDRTESIVAFLERASLPGQTLLVADPEFPLQFYLPLGILDSRLPPRPLDRLPDWILSESASGVLAGPPLELRVEIRDRYEPISVRVPRSRRGGGIPGPDTFEFFTAAENYDLIVYKKKTEEVSPPEHK